MLRKEKKERKKKRKEYGVHERYYIIIKKE
jgi:hypothetical protein